VVLDSGDPAGQASFARDAKRAFDKCVIHADNRGTRGARSLQVDAGLEFQGSNSSVWVPGSSTVAHVSSMNSFEERPPAGQRRALRIEGRTLSGSATEGEMLRCRL